MSRAVRFDRYGGPDVLHVEDVDLPDPAEGEVRVTVRAAGITTGESADREGGLAQLYPTAFPSGEGTEFAGVVTATGPGVDAPAVGDEVLGWSELRSAHADAVVVPAAHLVPKPAGLSWEVAASLYVSGVAAYGCIEAVGACDGSTVVVTEAAGGVGSFVVQLARLCGARVVGIAAADRHGWLEAHGVTPVTHTDDAAALADRVTAAAGGPVHAFVDTAGEDYEAVAQALGVAPTRATTTVVAEAATEFGDVRHLRAPEVLAELAQLVVDGRLHVPIAGSYPLEDVRDAYAHLERRPGTGKIVLLP